MGGTGSGRKPGKRWARKAPKKPPSIGRGMVTEWLVAGSETFPSQYGPVNNVRWLVLERTRINVGGGSYGKFPVRIDPRRQDTQMCLRNDLEVTHA